VSRTYPALEIHSTKIADEDYFDRLMAALDDASPTAVEERNDGSVRVFFGTEAARAHGAELLRAFVDLRVLSLEISDEDWAARSQKGLGPVHVGRIEVVTETDPGRRFSEAAEGKPTPGIGFRIAIPPSMGFGTGHHASTRRCLELLQRIPLEGARVLDAGTGSGLLAIAAWRLGAASVVALDCDPDALIAAAENLERNGASPAVQIVEVDLATLPRQQDPRVRPPFDLVLANLTGSLLERSAGILAGLLGPGGRLIASGFREDESRAVAEAFSRESLTIADRSEEEGWIGALFTSPSASRAL
jgi:ribosomal protein L11 methyltransferase